METNREISVPELTQAGRERTGMEDGGWRMEDGGWRMEDGGWRMEDGGWRMEDGGWRMEDGECMSVFGLLGFSSLSIPPAHPSPVTPRRSPPKCPSPSF